MKYFRLIRREIDTQRILFEISQVENAWYAHTGRQEKIAVQREACAIPIRGIRKSKIGGRKNRDVHDSRWTTGSMLYPSVRHLIQQFADELHGKPGRAKLVNLPVGSKVYPHTDRGEYYKLRDRYHLVVQSYSGSLLTSGDEQVNMMPGELWWFDNKQIHESFNDSSEDRIHLIFDLLPFSSDQKNNQDSREISGGVE